MVLEGCELGRMTRQVWGDGARGKDGGEVAVIRHKVKARWLFL